MLHYLERKKYGDIGLYLQVRKDGGAHAFIVIPFTVFTGRAYEIGLSTLKDIAFKMYVNWPYRSVLFAWALPPLVREIYLS